MRAVGTRHGMEQQMMIDPAAIALEMNRQATSVGAAGWLDGWPAVELIHYLPRGADPLPAVLALHGIGVAPPTRRVEVVGAFDVEPDRQVFTDELAAPPRPVTVLDPRSGGYRLIKPLRRAGVKIYEPSAADVAAATGEFLDMIASGALRYVACAELDAAVRVLEERRLAGATAFDRFRSKGADVGPAIACILSLWAMRNVPRHPRADIF